MGGDQSKAINRTDGKDLPDGRRRSSSAKQPSSQSHPRSQPSNPAPAAIVAHPPSKGPPPPEQQRRAPSFEERDKSPMKEFDDAAHSDAEEFDSPRRRSVVALHTQDEIDKIEKDLSQRSPPPAPLPPQSCDSSHGAMFHKDLLQLPEPDEIRKMSLQEMVEEGRKLSMNQPRAASLPVQIHSHVTKKHNGEQHEPQPAPPSDPNHAPNPHARRLQDSNGLVEVHHQPEIVLSDDEHLAAIQPAVAQQPADDDLPSVVVADEMRPTCAPSSHSGPQKDDDVANEGGAPDHTRVDPDFKGSSPLQSLADAMGNKRTFSVHSIDHQIPGGDPGLQIAAAELAEDIQKEKERIIQEAKAANPLGADGSPDEWEEEEDYRRGSAVLAFLHNKHHNNHQRATSTTSASPLPAVEHLSVATLKPPPPIPREHHQHHSGRGVILHSKGSAGNLSTNSSHASPPGAATATTEHLMAVPMDKGRYNSSTSRLEISATECDEKGRGIRSGSSGVLMPSGTFAAVQRQSSETYDREALGDVA